MIIHYYYSSNENSGEIRRIRNINHNLARKIDSEVIEVAFIPIRQINSKKFRLHPDTKKKYIFPFLPFPFSRAIASIINAVWSSLILGILCRIHHADFAIGEYSVASRSAQFLPKRTKLIIDCHGALREEYEYSCKNKSSLKYSKLLDKFENRSCQQATCVVCQSEYMKEHLIKKYHVSDADKLFVYKCNANTDIFKLNPTARKATRKKLNINDSAQIFIYSGGLHKWQRVNDALQIFEEYHSQYPDSKFILLTLDKIGAKNLVNNQFPNISKSVIIESANHDEVPDYLNAADAAFLLRDDTTLNAVASPTKLAEYMACGLAVISTNVSTYWINSTEFIFNIDKQSLSELNQFIRNTNRTNIENFARKHLSIERDNLEVQRLIYYAKSK